MKTFPFGHSFPLLAVIRLHIATIKHLACCCLLALAFSHPVNAQITITNSVFPVVGDTLRYLFGNQAGAINQIFTPPGGPQAWSLSGLQPTQTWNQIMRNPASGSAQASFPGASILYNPVNSTSQVYLQVTGTQVLDMGYFGLDELGLGLNLLFDKIPNLEDAWAPVNFFDIHQSTSNVLTAFDASIAPPILLNLASSADSFRIRVTYQRVSTVDAFGTLAIPGGTFDVLRKKQTEYKSIAVDVKVEPLGWIDISTIGGQQILPLGTDTITTFHFLNDVSKEAIAICTLNTAQNTVTGVQYKATALPPDAGPDQTLCVTMPAQLDATFTAGTPGWSVVSGPSLLSSQFSNTADPQAVFTPAGGPGEYVLRFTVTLNNVPASDDVKITFNPASIIDAGPDQTICANDTIHLHATLSGAATNMVWEKNVAFGTFIGSDTDPNANFMLNANGKAQPFIRFGAMSNDPAGPCPGGVDTVTIFINTAGPDQTLCITSAPAQLAASGSGQWSVVSGPSTLLSQFSSTTNPQATFTPADGAGTYTLRWTGANCTDDVNIAFNPASIIDAGPDQTICPNDTIHLHATLSGAATNMVWEKNVAFGTFIGPDTDPNANFLLNANGKAQPFIRFGAMSNDPAGPCPGGVDTVTIFINTAGPDQTLCITGAPAQLAASGSGQWSVVSGPSTLLSQFSSTTNPQATFTPAGGAGTYTLRWSTASCTDDVIIAFNPASIIDAGPDQIVCPEDTIFLHATLSGAATNMVWEKNVAFGVFVGPDTDPNAKFLLNANGKAQPFIRFGAMSNDPAGPCPGGVDTVTIFIRTPVPPVCPPPLMVCLDQAPFTLSGGTPGGGAFSGPGVNNNMFNAGAAGLGMHVLTYSAEDMNGCLGSCTFNVTVDNGVPIYIISNSSYCSGDPGPVIGVNPSFSGIQYQLQTTGGANLGAPVAGTGGPIYFGAYPNGTYRVVATSPQCTGSATATIQATNTDCRLSVPNFCTCNSLSGFTEVTIEVKAPPGMNWTVKDRIGLYQQLPPNLPMPIGTPMTYTGNNTYQLVGARTGKGYWVQVTNGFTDFDVMIGNASW